MNIRKIETTVPADVRAFIKFPFTLYKNSSHWIPPIAGEMELVLNREKHPFYKHSDAEFFIAEENGKTLGRIAIIHNRNYCQLHNQQIGFIYFFETVENKQVAHALIQAAVDWAKSRGLNEITFGRGIIRSNGIGVLVEGFEYQPSIGLPYNFPYYEGFILDFGFVEHTNHLTGMFNQNHKLPDRIYKLADMVKERGKFWIKTFKSNKEMASWIPLVDKVHHETFANNPGYYPSTPEEFDLLARSILAIADPRYIKAVMHGDDIAGFILAFPDISRAVQRTGGKIWPLGWIDFMIEKRRSKEVTVEAVGLLPQYHGTGANVLLYTELEKTVRENKIKRMQIIQVDERNFKSKSDMENMNVTWCIRHRTFRLDL